MIGMEFKDTYVGDEVTRSPLRWIWIKGPCTNGVITNWKITETILHHAFYNVLRAAPEEHPVLVVVTERTPKDALEKLTQIMFETFSVLALHIVPTSIAVLQDAGRTTGCVLDIGTESARLSAVVNRRVEVAVKSTTLGVSAVCASLRDLVMSEASFKAQPLWFTGTIERVNPEDLLVDLTNVYAPQTVVGDVDAWCDIPVAHRDGNPFGFRHEFGGRLRKVSASLLRPPSTLECLSVGDEVEFMALQEQQNQHSWQGGLAGEVKRVVRVASPGTSSAGSAAAAATGEDSVAASLGEEEAEHLVFWGNHLHTYGEERWSCTDFLFNETGLPSLITDSITAFDGSSRHALLSNLTVAGSIASLPNFDARLREALNMPRARSIVGLSAFLIARERRGDARFASIGAASGMRILAMMAEKIPLTAKEGGELLETLSGLERREELAEDLDDGEGHTIDVRGARSDMLDPSFAAWRGGRKLAAAHFLRCGRNDDDGDDDDEDCLAFWVTKEEYDVVGPTIAMKTEEEGGKCDYGCFALLPLKAGWHAVKARGRDPFEKEVINSFRRE